MNQQIVCNCAKHFVFLNMKNSKKPKNYWTKERCQKEALKYQHRKQFFDSSISAYNSARRNGFLDEICAHMTLAVSKKIFWTKAKCHEEALKYNSKAEFKRNKSAAYSAAYKKGFLDEICAEMKSLNKFNNYWTKERCQEEALKYKTRAEFGRGTSAAYSAAGKSGFLDEICTHMIEIKKPKGFWTKENCYKEALKYDSKSVFYRDSKRAYAAAYLAGFLDEICAHMTQRESAGEARVRNILQLYGVKFIQEKRFENCRDKKALPFDFYLPEQNVLIEYQGEQHFRVMRKNFFGGEAGLKNRQRRDQIKRDFCKSENIKLIEISYKDYKNIKRILIKQNIIN